MTPKLKRLPALAAVIAGSLVLAANAQAATTIGSDLIGTPGFGCSGASCTATNLGKPSGGNDIVAPSDGVVVRFRIRHGGFATGSPTFSIKVLSGTGGLTGDPATTDFAVVRETAQIPFADPAGGTQTVSTVDSGSRGLPISALQRIGVFVSSNQIAFERSAAGYSLAERDGDHTSGLATYSPFTSYEAMINADIEPDADGDGYGDETYDGCASVAGPGACPTSTGGGTIEERLVTELLPERLVTDLIPADYVKPRVGRLVRVRQPLSSLSRRPLSLPIACYGPCSAQGALVMSNIADAILRRWGYSARSVVVGRGAARATKGGKFGLRVALTPKGRRLLRQAVRRKAKLSVRTTVSDRWKKVSSRQSLIVTRR